MTTKWCPQCDGDGWVSAGWQGSDPEAEAEEPCSVCGGTGKVVPPTYVSTACMDEPQRQEGRFWDFVEQYKRAHPDLDEVYAKDWAREVMEPDEYGRSTV